MKLCASLALFVIGCLSGCALLDPADDVLGVGNARIIRQADKVDACLLRYSLTEDRRERYDELEYVAVPPELAARLQATLLHEGRYDRKISKPCAPRYVARLRFHRGNHTVAVDFCFHCLIMAVSRDGEQNTESDFCSAIFLTSMRQLFPDEPSLANRKTKKHPTRP